MLLMVITNPMKTSSSAIGLTLVINLLVSLANLANRANRDYYNDRPNRANCEREF